MARGMLTFFGHAFFSIVSPHDRVILIDPWIRENPVCPISVEEVERADLVLVTHDHFDHVGQTVEVLKNTGATLVANVETASRIMQEGELSQDQVLHDGYGMNIGATVEVKGIAVTQTQAFHSSATGVATGYIIRLEDGTTVYHAGDTGLFGSMEILAKTHGIDVALLPIGNVFTMDPVQAVAAVGLIQPKIVVPMHYQTFPILTPDAGDFIEKVRKHHPDVRVAALKPGERLELAV